MIVFGPTVRECPPVDNTWGVEGGVDLNRLDTANGAGDALAGTGRALGIGTSTQNRTFLSGMFHRRNFPSKLPERKNRSSWVHNEEAAIA